MRPHTADRDGAPRALATSDAEWPAAQSNIRRRSTSLVQINIPPPGGAAPRSRDPRTGAAACEVGAAPLSLGGPRTLETRTLYWKRLGGCRRRPRARGAPRRIDGSFVCEVEQRRIDRNSASLCFQVQSQMPPGWDQLSGFPIGDGAWTHIQKPSQCRGAAEGLDQLRD